MNSIFENYQGIELLGKNENNETSILSIVQNVSCQLLFFDYIFNHTERFTFRNLTITKLVNRLHFSTFLIIIGPIVSYKN